jgi:radical SAM protein with 4Fe4S-binding SPASM domain
MKSNFDIQNTPLVAIWEINHSDAQPGAQADDQVCAICQGPAHVAATDEQPDALELNTHEAEKLIRDMAELAPPILTITGGDPLQRPDLYCLIDYAVGRGLRPVLALPATPLLDRTAIAELKHAGLSRLSLNLDGASPELHDLISGVHGSYARTMEAVHWANDWRLPLQITTHLSTHNLNDLENLAALLKTCKIVLWTVVFPVPASKSEMEKLPSAAEFEQTFATLYKIAQQVSFKIKTVEAQHYRRYVLQQGAKARADKLWRAKSFTQGIPGVLPVNEAKATVFVSSTGEVYPSPNLRISAGNVRVHKLAAIYRGSELFMSLRDSASLKGKCGECGFKVVCGGSRARALVLQDDMFQQDATCIYHPGAQKQARKKQAPKLPLQQVAVEKP